jgi:hypothetical protein
MFQYTDPQPLSNLQEYSQTAYTSLRGAKCSLLQEGISLCGSTFFGTQERRNVVRLSTVVPSNYDARTHTHTHTHLISWRIQTTVTRKDICHNTTQFALFLHFALSQLESAKISSFLTVRGPLPWRRGLSPATDRAFQLQPLHVICIWSEQWHCDRFLS